MNGGDGNDAVSGFDGSDTLYGGDGNDLVDGGEGNDSLFGGNGTDTLIGGNGGDYLDGGAGADVMAGGTGDDTYVIDNGGDVVNEAAGAGFDTIYTSINYNLAAGAEIEVLAAGDRNALAALVLTGNELDNNVWGNAGANVLNGGDGNDAVSGFDGSDTLYGGDGNDLVDGGEGNDSLFGGNGTDTLIGGNGGDYLDGGAGADVMVGGAGDDTYVVDNGGDVVNEATGGGFDTVYTSVNYTLAAGAEIEILSAGDRNAATALALTGNAFANNVWGNAGANILDGGDGDDAVSGFDGNDTLYGGAGADLLSGGNNDDTLNGGDNNDTLLGEAGNDILDGGAGADTMVGGAGSDTFVFYLSPPGGIGDVIQDFTAGTDKILLGGAAGQAFAALATGSLRAGTLVIGTAAVDADDYLIYNSATGALLYDADGAGGNAAVQFATLSTGLSLTVADFTVSGAANTAPSITSGATASVAENSATSTIVYQTAATDADGDRITYSLSGADAGLLSIDASGAVRLLASADYETKTSYVFNVIASDSGVATVKAVTLTITDVNDTANTPTVNETAAANDTYQTAQAIDPNTFVVAANPNLYDPSLPSATIIGSISTLSDVGNVSSDVDFYSITLQAGQQLILDVDIDPANGLDSFLSLYGPGGVFIGDNDDLISADPGSGTQFGHNTDSQIIFRAATSGTYYFSIKSYTDDGTNQPTSKGSYTLNVSVNSTPATPQQIMAEDVQALVSGASWTHAGPAFNLTYGFPDQATYYPSSFAEVTPATDFEAFSATQQAATRSLLQLISNVTQITFTENTTQGQYNVAGTAANANLRYAESTEADVAYAYYPTNTGSSSLGGSAWFNHDDFNNPARGNYAWMGILHETGHALGLKHGHEFPLAISADHDSVEYSVMTYRSYPGGSTTSGYSNETYGYAQTLMMLDIAALQKIYGSANYAFNSGNSVYTWSSTTGEMSINGVGQGAPGTGQGGTSNRVFMTIWDGGGNDTYDLSNYNSGTTIDLRPGEWTTTSSTQLANLGSGHFARGNVANALLFEGNTASLIENAIGGVANDTLIANQVSNQLTGNGGVDTFKWMANGDAGTGALADTVTDFSRGFDKIDFSNLDANPATGAHDAFTFLGTGAFTNVAGQVRYDVTGGSAHIFADVDGNGTADMEIILTNVATLAGSDFNF
ncbi:M10 family metallopeptidase C-terminal domain-containing protein [Allosphingosinicella sp.]|uniref:M10 family metallopeptidase C-terminal domain-containing protein n=1 Tax=Allosphingosinicella sp. TaxID=2823234 RepID=UPI003783BC97